MTDLYPVSKIGLEERLIVMVFFKSRKGALPVSIAGIEAELYRDLEGEGRCLYLSRKDVESLGITMGEVISLVEEALRQKGLEAVEMPPKPGIHPRKDAFIHAMPAFIPKLGAAGIKWVSGYPGNHKYNLPYITGLLILNSPETGVPFAVMDCTWITEVRTAAATAVAAKYLARKESKVVAIIGCGVQGRSNLRALNTLMDIELVKAYDINGEALAKYVREMGEELALEVQPTSSPQEAVLDADIIVTATPILREPKPVIERAWLKEGSLGVPLDFDSYWKPEALSCVDKFYVDDERQFEHYKAEGHFTRTPAVYGDLGEVVVGKKPGREHDEERIVSMNLGLAIEDMATAAAIFERARRRDVGTLLKL